MKLDKSRPLEPAIPEYLRVPRTRPAGIPDSYLPVTQSYSARFKPSVKALPMAFYGVQYQKESDRSAEALADLALGFAAPHGPAHWDRAEYIDELGYINAVFVGYWDSKATYHAWQDGLPSDWWRAQGQLDGDLGFFRECYTPGIEDTETTFSHPYPEGYSNIADSMSGEVREHGYWGSSRDRIPRSQTDSLEPKGRPRCGAETGRYSMGRHIVIEPHENLCLLRSGQDWRDAGAFERKLYLERVEPVLRSGMLFLQNDGKAIGCFFNRFMQIVTESGPVDKTYSLSAWYGLDATENWAKASAHLAIFGAGVNHYNTVGEDAKLRIYHEMSVIRAQDQAFEYFNCHPKTGMLNAVFGD
jgi:aldoxime dehydratase